MTLTFGFLAALNMVGLWLIYDNDKQLRAFKKEVRDANRVLDARIIKFYDRTTDLKKEFSSRCDLIKSQSDSAYQIANNSMLREKREIKVKLYRGKMKRKIRPLLPKVDSELNKEMSTKYSDCF